MGDRDTASKQEIRQRIWRLLEERGVAVFPTPVAGRIPNFKGAAEAANLLRKSKHYIDADVVKVNPDAPQAPVRRNVLRDGKKLIMPTPRIKHGFLLINPKKLHQRGLRDAATIAGAYRYGAKVEPRDLPSIDLVVVGSVAVSPMGWRIGKGEGYSEIEYALLRTFSKVDEDTPVYTTVHDLQVVDKIPHEAYDLPVDRIFTNTRVINCPKNPKPSGIIWNLLPREKIEAIPLLQKLRVNDV
ncbi:MAG: 5-formyltetrahydrofolate cyclo-ligase [Candidatus Caldarchaeum sp.]|uniref:5-formyltetrahydrofolate cyclo-ligase n=1 Tax=Caldiarchaeum subterraneum TaxID=311458 RepID=A0A7C4E0T6_CALS0|nr:5-formyltetrahydrofolate cyclo-ligase [Candidatus Caldarchaeales archaeon]